MKYERLQLAIVLAYQSLSLVSALFSDLVHILWLEGRVT